MPKTPRPPIRFGVKWPDVDRGPWHVLFDFSEVAGRLECVGVAIRSFQESHTVTDEGRGDVDEWLRPAAVSHGTAAG